MSLFVSVVHFFFCCLLVFPHIDKTLFIYSPTVWGYYKQSFYKNLGTNLCMTYSSILGKYPCVEIMDHIVGVYLAF